MSGSPRVDPGQAAAEERLGGIVQGVLVAVAALAVTAVLLGPDGRGLAWVAVGAVTAIPLARVAWLVVRWTRVRDWRYVAVAVLLLVLVAVGPVVALLQR
jgi:hypothetical protein